MVSALGNTAGGTPFATGADAFVYPQMIWDPLRAPNTTDYYNPGTRWQDNSVNPAVQYYTIGMGIWYRYSNSVSLLDTLSDNAGTIVFPSSSNNIQFTSTAGTIQVVADVSNHSINLDLTGGLNAIEKLTGDDSMAVVPTAGNINLQGLAVANATFSKPLYTEKTATSTETIAIQAASSAASAALNNAGISSFRSTQFSVDSSTGFVSLTGGNGPALQGLADDNDDFVGPTGSPEQIQLVGHVVEAGPTKFSTVVAGTNLININPMSPARWIVDPFGFNGTHTTITAAMASASSGDTILLFPSSYSESFTMTPGTMLTGLGGSFTNATTSITGKITCSGAGGYSISNLQLHTSSDYFLSITGSNNTAVTVANCFLDCPNHTGINAAATGAGANVIISNCQGAVGGSYTLFSSSIASFNMYNCFIFNSSGTSTASTVTGGTFISTQCVFQCPIAVSSSAGFISYNSDIAPSSGVGGPYVALQVSGSATAQVSGTTLSSGGAACITTSSSSAINIYSNLLISSASNVISGTGAINIAGNTIVGAGGISNTGTVTGTQNFTGAGSPNGTLSAPQGSFYLNTTGSGVSSRAYINSSGGLGTTWVAVTTAG